MPSALPAAMLTELQGQARVHFTFDIALPNTSGGTTTYRFAEKAVASESQGEYLPYATELGTVARSTGFPTFGFQNPRTSIRIFDKDRVLQKAIGGPASGRVISASANSVMRSFYVASASHYTVMPGKVKDFSLSDEYTWDFAVGPDIEELESKLKIPRLEELWEPKSIPLVNRLEPGRVIWGEWVSDGRSSTGAIEAFFVDATNKYWYVSSGHFPDSSITNVFVDDTSETADWTMLRILRNGNPVTVLRYDGGSAYDEDNTVTFDCTGLDDDGDSSATLERLPSEALQITLSNFAFGEWPVGATNGSVVNTFNWLSIQPELDNTSFTNAAVYHTLLNHEIAAIWTSDQSGLDIMAEYMDSFFLPVFWSDEFKLKVGLLNLHERDIYPSAVFRKDQREIADISGASFGEDRISRVNIAYMLDAVGGSFDRRFLAANEDLGFTKIADHVYQIGGPSRVP